LLTAGAAPAAALRRVGLSVSLLECTNSFIQPV